jgi:nitronate monooxygenase
VLSGAIASGDAILAALAAGADLAYIGTRFPRHAGSERADRYKEEIVRSAAGDIVYTDLFSGVHGITSAQRRLRRLRSAQPAEVGSEEDEFRLGFGRGEEGLARYLEARGKGRAN